MQTLTGTVGDKGVNARHDVALVQAMLALTQRPARLDPGRAKYLSLIDGDCGKGTQAAIRQFQNDQVFVGPAGNALQAVPGATAGRVAPGDPTWTKLRAALPAEYSDLRALNGSKTVYVAATAEQASASVARVAQMTFGAAFRTLVIGLVGRIHSRHGIAIAVCREGDRRSFQTQYELLTSGRGVTHAGPGESNHNFGQGVDLGFANLRWLRPDARVVENEDAWLHQLDPQQRVTGEALFFWDVLRSEGLQTGMHRGPLGDRPHLQAWPDAGIDMAARLADLLTRAGNMRWTGRNQRYQCDLGFGGRFFDAGSAAQVWGGQATITVATLMQARAQAVARLDSAAMLVRVGALQPAASGTAAVTAQDVAAMQAALRADFVAADAGWQHWRVR